MKIEKLKQIAEDLIETFNRYHSDFLIDNTSDMHTLQAI